VEVSRGTRADERKEKPRKNGRKEKVPIGGKLGPLGKLELGPRKNLIFPMGNVMAGGRSKEER